jgi:glutamine amidotransferase
MCRRLAYAGHAIAMATLLFQPGNSLIRQSLSAQRSVVPTDGDGFGLGWYGDLPAPGLFRDTMPAWNDANLRRLAEQIRSRLFFAHVRASTGTAPSRLNCHPLRREGWLFMHNGKVGGYHAIRRPLEQLIPTACYNHREGTTDCEVFFLLALANGMDADPLGALACTVAAIKRVMAANAASEPLRITAAASDGRRIVALRYASSPACSSPRAARWRSRTASAASPSGAGRSWYCPRRSTRCRATGSRCPRPMRWWWRTRWWR